MTFVPLRFISENLNATVKWNQSTNEIVIKPKGNLTTNINSTEVEEINNVLNLNTKYFNDKDPIGFISTFSSPTETIPQLQVYFDTNNMHYIVDDIQNIVISGNTATALFIRISEISYVSNGVTYTTMKDKVDFNVTLSKKNDQWKINKFTYIKQEYLLKEESLEEKSK